MKADTFEIKNSLLNQIKNLKYELGNIIYYITKYSGIKYLVDKYHKLRGTKCDCNNRRKK